MVKRLDDRGHGVVRPAHGAVFQAMAELVTYLEKHDYVKRVPDPGDRRAKLVVLRPTRVGRSSRSRGS